MAQGHKTGGRLKGSKNKAPGFRESVLRVLEKMGHGEFLKWAKANPTDFYTKVATRLIPHEVSGPEGGPIPLKIELTDAIASESKHRVSK